MYILAVSYTSGDQNLPPCAVRSANKLKPSRVSSLSRSIAATVACPAPIGSCCGSAARGQEQDILRVFRRGNDDEPLDQFETHHAVAYRVPNKRPTAT